MLFGTCGLAGFKDGFSYNTLLNKPTQLGYDRLGNVYVNDQGNNHIWIITLPSLKANIDAIISQSTLRTLVHGSCFVINQTQDNFPY